MSSVISLYDRLVSVLSGRFFESIALLFTRVALAGIFWRSYQTKVVEGTWFQIDPFQYDLFRMEFSGLPLPVELSVPMATYAEFLFPVLLVLGLATRFSALALMIMALVIQLFVFPTQAHFLGWAIMPIAMGLILIGRGAGTFSLDALIAKVRGQ
ncbi:MAG: DoxX family protein [Pseudomonadota bacterium]